MTVMQRSSFEQHEEQHLDLKTMALTLLDHKKLIAGITAGFLAVGIAYAVLSTPQYVAGAMIQIEPKKNALTAVAETVVRPNSASPAVAEIELLKSRAVLTKTVENLRLDIEAKPRFFPLIGHYLWRHYEADKPGQLADAWPQLRGFAWGGEKIDVFQFDVPDDMYGETLTVVAGSNGRYRLLDKDKQPLLDGQVGQMAAGNGYRMQIKTLTARPGTEFKVTRNRVITTAQLYQNRIKTSEAGKESGIIYLSLADENPDLAKSVLSEISRLYVLQNVERSSAEAAQRLDFLRGQLPAVRKDLESAEAALNNYQTNSRSVDISLETKAVLDKIVTLDTSISQLKLKQAEYDRLYTRDHPSYKTLLNQLAQLEVEKRSLQRKVEALPSTQQELLRLNRDMKVTNQTYQLLLNQAQEQDIIRAGTIGNVRLVDNADVNLDEPATNRKIALILSLLLGLVTSVVVVFVRQAFQKGIENPDTVEQIGLPVYSTLPFTKDQERLNRRLKKKTRTGEPNLLSVVQPANLAVESLRSLRSSLHFAMLEAKNRVIMISSPTPGVGKSFVSSNLAAVVAQSGQRVLLIDADMRKGYLHRVFGLQPQAGLSELLTGRSKLREAIVPSGIAQLDIISCGQAAPNPSELLMHANFSRLLDEVGGLYDLVIIDTPPILAVTDAALVGRLAGTTLLVTRFGQSTLKAVENSRRRFAQNGITIKGAILNGVQRKASTSMEDDGVYGYYEYGPRT
ncbi:polysaccharide biosynthesis tyrosine autokinase [Pseudomonas oryzihabitans]|uniref:polysaccharide biosynthesis tyrosine autokinase n=1 Tax=Pseudomonas oryzihabitans TaxID=47885 RepID=UPI001F52B35A|nr:polysaccharide biosynthesis tyrosine autokinase [Pseudomonas oryzihabitans]MCI1008986.1 polysaccharide biosynthesis tyrosine autokinase [Pseudomonas oryzihabitans]